MRAVADPQFPVIGCQQRFRLVRAQPFALREIDNRQGTKHVQPARGAHPEVALAVFEKTLHVVAGQSVDTGEVIEPIADQPKHAAIRSADPKRVLVIDKQLCLIRRRKRLRQYDVAPFSVR